MPKHDARLDLSASRRRCRHVRVRQRLRVFLDGKVIFCKQMLRAKLYLINLSLMQCGHISLGQHIKMILTWMH
jgi:hypothetical protein